MFKNSKGNAFPRLCSLSKGMHYRDYLGWSSTAFGDSFVPRGYSGISENREVPGTKASLHAKDKMSENFESFPSFYQSMFYISGVLKIFLAIFST